ncbi:MAG: LysR family transcriptional regulator [Deltaproteobacteria bacterium]|nr:LysR family transcriptional regulator [Deltaproteobacteria bacterium]
MRPENLRSLDLNLLAVADALLETRNVTETARLMNLSQPAVSRALGRLRAQLGDPLLIRERRGMRLTPFAQGLRPRLRSALLQLERTLTQAERFDPARATGAITIACADYAAVAFMPGALAHLTREAPALALVLVPYVEPFEALLEAGECDAVVGHRRSDKSWIESQPLFDSGWCAVARRRHPWLRDGSLDGYCAAQHIMVSPQGQGAGPVDAVLSRLGRERRVVARVPEFAAALSIAARTELLATIPERLAASAAAVFRLEAAPVPFEMHTSRVFLSWHAAHTADPRACWAREMIEAVVAASG